MAARQALIAFLMMIAAAPVAAAQKGKLVTETEPNDSFPAADVVQFGDTISGFINQHSDEDFFAVDIPAGKIQVSLTPDFCPGLRLYDRDKHTVLALLHCYSAPDTLYLTI